MATTSPDNIWTPDAGDDYALTVDLAAMADTIQDALNEIRSPAFSNVRRTSDLGNGVTTNWGGLVWNSNPTSQNVTWSGNLITVQKAGHYRITGTARLGSTSFAQARIAVSGVVISPEWDAPARPNGIATVNFSFDYDFPANTAFELQVVSNVNAAVYTNSTLYIERTRPIV